MSAEPAFSQPRRAVRRRAGRLRARRGRLRAVARAGRWIGRPARARSSAWPPPSAAVPLNAWPDKPEPLVRTMRSGARGCRPGAGGRRRRLCVGERDPRARCRPRRAALDGPVRRIAPGRHVDQGRARRVRRVGRRRVCGRVPVRARGAGAADCRLGAPDRGAAGLNLARDRSRRPGRSCSSTASRAAARCSASCSARRRLDA